MPRGKRLSKKIHDKKKSNPKRSIRQSKKGGGVFKTEMVVVDELITYMEEFTKEKDLNKICNDSILSALISRINSVVGNTLGLRFRGVESCSDLLYTNTNTEDYFKCEEKKIEQYKQIHDLCSKIYGILEKNCKRNSTPGENLYPNHPGNNIKFGNYRKFDLLSEDAKKLMRKHERKLEINPAYKDYKEDLKNKKIIKLEEDLPTYSKTEGTDLYNTYKNEETKATVSDVEYFYIEDNELVKLGKIQYVYDKWNDTYSRGEGGAGNVTRYHYIKFDNRTVLAYTSLNEKKTNQNNFYSKSTPEMKEEATAEPVENETAANQPGGKRRSCKKRNMKKSKKGKSKNRR